MSTMVMGMVKMMVEGKVKIGRDKEGVNDGAYTGAYECLRW